MRLQFGGHQELPAGDVLEAGGRKAESTSGGQSQTAEAAS
jgi:6-phosphogluconate dehydrogenase